MKPLFVTCARATASPSRDTKPGGGGKPSPPPPSKFGVG